MPNTTNYLKQFVAFSVEKLQQDLSLEAFKENLVNEARAIINNASTQSVTIELQRLEKFLQSEIKYQLLQYRKKYAAV
ncbi:MAG: hypothetical protein JNK79_14890 [Chitinophagaceae bacterium]|nr:hypothetical protein [Chitinophagaceae bacterium]